jgi:hypothetical protein
MYHESKGKYPKMPNDGCCLRDKYGDSQNIVDMPQYIAIV